MQTDRGDRVQVGLTQATVFQLLDQQPVSCRFLEVLAHVVVNGRIEQAPDGSRRIVADAIHIDRRSG